MRSLRLSARVLLSAALAGCSAASAPVMDIDVIGTEAAPFETGVRLSPAAQLIRSATNAGLVGFDEQGQVIPGLADRWIVTEDGLSYIFRLRDGSWPDGSEITGESAAGALGAALGRLKGTSLALDLAGIEEVRAMAGRVVEVRLTHPAPDLLQLLAQPELGLVYKGRGSGPMLLRREGAAARLTPIQPARLGLPQPDDWAETVRDLRVHGLPADSATRRFARGDVDLVLGGRFESLPLAQAVAGLSQRFLHVDPVPGLFGLGFTSSRGPLGSGEVRRALVMAVDRDLLADSLAVPDWVAVQVIIPPGAKSAEGASASATASAGTDWIGQPIEVRRDGARRRVQAWVARHGPFPALSLALPDGPGADTLFARIKADWAAVGIETVRAAPGSAGADLRLIDAVARYQRPEWYLNQFACAASRGLCSSAADALVRAARAEADPARSAQLLGQAETVLERAAIYVPLGAPVRWSLVRNDAGFAANATGYHPLPPLAQRPR